MKTLAQYIMESHKTYEFVIKLADVEVDNEMLDRIEHALSAYDVNTISKPKRLPIAEHNIDFPSLRNCEVTLLVAELNYPCTDEQVRAALGAQGRIQLANIVVVPKNHPEEMRREEELAAATGKKSVLDSEMESVSGGQVQVGQGRVDSMLKELESRKYEFAAKPEPAQSELSSIAQNNTSPIGKGRSK